MSCAKRVAWLATLLSVSSLGAGGRAADLSTGRVLTPLADAPLVQMLVPGFAVRELPVDLPNINNVRYRPDGRLFALAYNGNIYLLSDTDGDGLEDHVEVFWENQGRLRGPIGVALTPPGYKHGDGLFVPSKGKLSLIVDRDGDDRADEEIIVATGWQEIIQNVDAIGVALAPDGSVYFGLGTTNFANGYLIDESGLAHYDLASERGTVLRVSPDFKTREIVCTGVRFPLAMAFNDQGDLFCTDQEGATWLSNGNPRDELLHIQPDRHYGFPPRHPKHLPGVIDEPSVFDFGPQHQSTCGLFFNRSVHGGPAFGPSWWTGDAIICGESRGKLFRTSLVKTDQGYIAQNSLIACLGMLTVDACVSPAGNLVVACHSGPPDWGTGPEGRGKLFRVEYVDPDAPQSVRAWSAGPQEVRIAFDRPLDPLALKDLARRVHIEYGAYVRPGDRFEVLKPPYAIVERQLATPRFDLAVLGVQLAADGRTLIIATAHQTQAAAYALTLDQFRDAPHEVDGSRIEQAPAVDVGYDLTGVLAEWTAAAGQATLSSWLPHLDLHVSREFTRQSAEQQALWPRLDEPGRLVLRTQLDLSHMLQPLVQEGTELDYDPPPENVTLRIHSSRPMQVRAGSAEMAARAAEDGHAAQVDVKPQRDAWLPLELEIETGPGGPTEIDISFATADDPRPRPLQVRRFLLPWARSSSAPAAPVESPHAVLLARGDWDRGRQLFESEQIGCAKCHRLGDLGGRIGPDLGNLPQRDYASVVRDILDPNAMLNPDYIGFAATLKSGQTISGVVLSSTEERIVIGDSTGKEIEIPSADVDELAPSKISVMPNNFRELLTDQQVADLMTFLLTNPSAAE